MWNSLNNKLNDVPTKGLLRIAISGKSGCGNSTASRLLAERLNITLINYTFRNLAEDMGLSFNKLRELAEGNDNIDIKLDQKQIDMASKASCVLGSRLAIWLLDADLKIYLNISLEERAKRIHRRENGSFDTIKEQTQLRDQLDSNRYKRIYNIDTNNFEHAGLIIDDDNLTPEQIVDIIMAKLSTLSI
ncbi:MAG: cytidylate kinase family protein [Spirochaetaceae bacterium]|nr:cytidylate kinase family protein [Spirochaetaceae bacterium]